MTGLVTTELRIHNAKKFVESVGNEHDNMYMFLAKPLAWEDDNIPPTPLDSVHYKKHIWDEMVAMKRLTNADVRHGLRRIDWESGDKYDVYDDRDSYLHVRKWYVMNEMFQVFMCLDNGRKLVGGSYEAAPSTYNPFFDPAQPEKTVFKYPDGYTWKYIYSVAPGEALKFATPSWIPVSTTQLVEPVSVSGIYNIILSNFGIGYNEGECDVVIEGDGTGAQAVPVIEGGQIVRIDVVDPGEGYTEANVTIVGPAAQEASARAVVFNFGGVGTNPIDNLLAYYTICSGSFAFGEDGNVPVFNDFRQFGVIKDPLTTENEVAKGIHYNMFYRLEVSSEFGFEQDEEVTWFGGHGRVTSYDVTTAADKKYLELFGTVGTPLAEDVVISSKDGEKHATVVEVIKEPTLIPRSGQFLYIENNQPIHRRGDQIETFVLVAEW